MVDAHGAMPADLSWASVVKPLSLSYDLGASKLPRVRGSVLLLGFDTNFAAWNHQIASAKTCARSARTVRLFCSPSDTFPFSENGRIHT